MSHHLTEDGQFKSDKYPWCPAGFIALKFTDPLAQKVLLDYADETKDKELASDIRKALAVQPCPEDHATLKLFKEGEQHDEKVAAHCEECPPCSAILDLDFFRQVDWFDKVLGGPGRLAEAIRSHKEKPDAS